MHWVNTIIPLHLMHDHYLTAIKCTNVRLRTFVFYEDIIQSFWDIPIAKSYDKCCTWVATHSLRFLRDPVRCHLLLLWAWTRTKGTKFLVHANFKDFIPYHTCHNSWRVSHHCQVCIEYHLRHTWADKQHTWADKQKISTEQVLSMGYVAIN